MTEEELTSTITRIPWKERTLSAVKIRELLTMSEPGSLFVVVKLVPLHLGRQLPNYLLETVADLPGLDDFLSNTPGHFAEVWYCLTRVDASVFSVAGRIAFGAQGGARQVIEQVWRTSPRKIEQFGRLQFEWPYARASRWSWGWKWQSEQLYIPPNSSLQIETLQADLSRVTRAIYERQETLEEFVRVVEACGLTSHSIEYKVVGEHVSVIDWDTSDDRKVLRAVFRD